VGGSSSGWLSAALLQRALAANPQRRCTITLVESPQVGTIGVGEALVISFLQTMDFLGLEEDEWMVACDAAFKLGMKFVGWCGPGGPDYYWSIFGAPPVRRFPLWHYWLKRKLEGDDPGPYGEACVAEVALCEAKKAPKVGNERPYHGQVAYSYNLDAQRLAAYLRQVAVGRGVRHVLDHVTAVALDPSGFIDHVKTREHGDLHADLFLDCTGFRGRLIREALGEPFLSYSDVLFCDRAVALPIPSDGAREGVNPYITATALDAGWAFHTPLFRRSGNGYLYASAFLSPDQAEAELRRHVGPKAEGVSARHLTMQLGRVRDFWAKNCVAVGLSGGFIDALHATSIYLIELGIWKLLDFFPDRSFAPPLARRYNRWMADLYEELRDLIVLHYCTTHREDTPFWRHNKYHPHLPESLREDLEFFQVSLPEPGWKRREGRSLTGLTAVLPMLLAGMNRLPERSPGLLEHRPGADADESFQEVRERSARLLEQLPDHYDYLSRLHAGRIGAYRTLFPDRSPGR
jgi:tryptophan halogenase